MIIFDTDTVTLHSYGRSEKLRDRIEKADGEEELAITLVTRMEILQGRFARICKAANQEELRVAVEHFEASERLLRSFVWLGVNAEAQAHFENLRTGKKTRKMKRGDMLIASIALAHKALLVTRNTKDYKDVPGLPIENWADYSRPLPGAAADELSPSLPANGHRAQHTSTEVTASGTMGDGSRRSSYLPPLDPAP